MIASVLQFKEYTGVNTDSDDMMQIYLESAEQIVVNYLGYHPESESYTDIYDGGVDSLQLSSKPVQDVTSFTENGDTIDPDDYYIKDERVYIIGRELAAGRRNILITYTAGFTADDMPGVIKMTVLRIAALMQTEADGNIGITSKQFGDTGSRTFIQTTNFDKYLKILSRYRLMRL